MKNEIVKLGVILFVICLIAAGLLAVTNGITAPIIAQSKLQNEIEAKQAILPQAEDFKNMDNSQMQELFKNSESENLNNIKQITTATANGKFAGLVIKTSVKGFSGDIEMLIGIDSNGSIVSYKVLTSSETAGLGDKIASDSFIDQFANKKTDEKLLVVKREAQQDNEIQALTGATISSKAAALAVNSAAEAYNIFVNMSGGMR